jgi:hypothetical protein
VPASVGNSPVKKNEPEGDRLARRFYHIVVLKPINQISPDPGTALVYTKQAVPGRPGGIIISRYYRETTASAACSK